MSKVLKAVNTAVSDENDDTKRKQGLMPRWDDNDELLDRTLCFNAGPDARGIGPTIKKRLRKHETVTQFWFNVRATVYDAGPTLNQHWVTTSYFLEFVWGSSPVV